MIIKQIKQYEERRKHSADLLAIYEGDLLKYVENFLASEFSPQTFQHVKYRIPPINLLRKIVDKLSVIYNRGGPQRKIVDGTDRDQELLDWYAEKFEINCVMNQANEFLNLDKFSMVQPYIDTSMDFPKPKLRVLNNSDYCVYSDNDTDPTVVTHVAVKAGMNKVPDKRFGGGFRDVPAWIVYGRERVFAIDEEGNPAPMVLEQAGLDGFNPIGKLPFQYFNTSKNFLIPRIDSDTKRMATLIPVLLADLNYAVKFQSFSIMYLINGRLKDKKFAPNLVLDIETDDESDKDPVFGNIKPQVDIDQVIRLAVTELSMWLNSKGIRVGQIGDMGPDNLASGISKIVDESDTAENRERQVSVFQPAEVQLWETVLRHQHPFWVSQGLVENRHILSPNARIEVEFPEQLPLMSRKEIVSTVIQEIQQGLLSVETGIAKINPEWDQQRIDEEITLIRGERETIIVGEDNGRTTNSEDQVDSENEEGTEDEGDS